MKPPPKGQRSITLDHDQNLRQEIYWEGETLVVRLSPLDDRLYTLTLPLSYFGVMVRVGKPKKG